MGEVMRNSCLRSVREIPNWSILRLTSLAKVKPAGSSNDGAILAASSSAFCSATRDSSISSSSSSKAAEYFARRDTGRSM